jgi:hypothetical protein
VISPLAIGADQIVARRVLARMASDYDALWTAPRLEAIVPLPVEEYRTEFAAGGEREEFDRLLARDTRPTVLAWPTEGSSGEPRPPRGPGSTCTRKASPRRISNLGNSV